MIGQKIGKDIKNAAMIGLTSLLATVTPSYGTARESQNTQDVEQQKQAWVLAWQQAQQITANCMKAGAGYSRHKEAKLIYFPSCNQLSFIEGKRSVEDVKIDDTCALEFETWMEQNWSHKDHKILDPGCNGGFCIVNIFPEKACNEVNIAEAGTVVNVVGDTIYLEDIVGKADDTTDRTTVPAIQDTKTIGAVHGQGAWPEKAKTERASMKNPVTAKEIFRIDFSDVIWEAFMNEHLVAASEMCRDPIGSRGPKLAKAYRLSDSKELFRNEMIAGTKWWYHCNDNNYLGNADGIFQSASAGIVIRDPRTFEIRSIIPEPKGTSAVALSDYLYVWGNEGLTQIDPKTMQAMKSPRKFGSISFAATEDGIAITRPNPPTITIYSEDDYAQMFSDTINVACDRPFMRSSPGHIIMIAGNRMKLYDTKTHEIIWAKTWPGKIRSIALSDEYLFMDRNEDTSPVYDLYTLREACRVPAHCRHYGALGFFGNKLYIGDDGEDRNYPNEDYYTPNHPWKHTLIVYSIGRE